MTRTMLRWEATSDLSPSTYLDVGRLYCGIYVLEFDGGDRYVGQTVNLLSRLGSHRRRWSDICAVSFTACTPEELNQLEREMIREIERDHPVRNRAYVGIPGGAVPLDLVVDRQEQEAWLYGVQPAYPEDERTRAAERRIRTESAFAKLRAHEQFDALMADLTAYAELVIPWPGVTGGRFWGMTAMPGTARTAEQRRLVTINAHNVEVLYVMELSDGEILVRINMAPEIIGLADLRTWRMETHSHYRAYSPCVSATVPLGSVRELLESSPEITAAARKAAWGLMRRGRSNFAKHHNDRLLDEILVRLPKG